MRLFSLRWSASRFLISRSVSLDRQGRRLVPGIGGTEVFGALAPKIFFQRSLQFCNLGGDTSFFR